MSVPCILCKELVRPWALVSVGDPGASHLHDLRKADLQLAVK